MVGALAAAGVRMGAEPIIGSDMSEAERETILRCMAHFEVFSPDEEAMTLLVGERPLQEQLRALARYGPRLLALRQGAQGSLLYDREEDRFWKVPVVPADVVDVTGAGNAYSGGLLVGWVATGEACRAAAYAAASASIVIEQIGPPAITPQREALVRQRYAAILPQIQPWEEPPNA